MDLVEISPTAATCGRIMDFGKDQYQDQKRRGSTKIRRSRRQGINQPKSRADYIQKANRASADAKGQGPIFFRAASCASEIGRDSREVGTSRDVAMANEPRRKATRCTRSWEETVGGGGRALRVRRGKRRIVSAVSFALSTQV